MGRQQQPAWGPAGFAPERLLPLRDPQEDLLGHTKGFFIPLPSPQRQTEVHKVHFTALKDFFDQTLCFSPSAILATTSDRSFPQL